MDEVILAKDTGTKPNTVCWKRKHLDSSWKSSKTKRLSSLLTDFILPDFFYFQTSAPTDSSDIT